MTSGRPIDCREALELLQDYLRAELPPETAHLVHEHLERCPPCLCHERFERNFLERLGSLHAGKCCPDRVRLRILAALRVAAEERPPS